MGFGSFPNPILLASILNCVTHSSKLKLTKKAWRSGELAFRLPITEVDNCNIADILFISQIYNVKPELKHNKEQKLKQYSSSPNNAKPLVGRSIFSRLFYKVFIQ